MSASEKLKALEEPLQEFGLPCSELGPGLHDFVLSSDYRALALPQIVAVVEAAESYVAHAQSVAGTSGAWPLASALAALEEALA